VAVEADLGGGSTEMVVGVVALVAGGSTEMVVGVVALVAGAIEIVEELVVFVGYKASELEVFGVAVAGRVGKSVEVVGQQR
jgi:hypothetical protein